MIGLLAVAFGVGVAPVGAADSDLALVGMPTDMTVTATQLGGAVVNYTLPTNGDLDDTDGVITCTPNTGAVFPIGTTTVTCVLNDPNDDTNNPVSASFNVTVTPGPPATLTLSPGNTTVGLFTPVTETATVKDQYGNPVADGTTVNFSVTGANTTSGSATTTNGQAPFTYTNSAAFPGVDTLTATAVGGTNPSATATITWVLPASTPWAHLSATNFTTPYVYLAASTAGSGGPSGFLTWQGGGVSLQTVHFSALVASGPNATLFGTATVGGQTVAFRIDAVAGANLVELRLSTGYDSGMVPIMSVRVTP